MNSTRYVIKLTKQRVYVAPDRGYTHEIAQAVSFEFMTTASLVAIELLDLALDDFEIVACVSPT